MVGKRDYYEVLGVTPEATDAEIKRAYRQRARDTHPDVSDDPEAEQQFKELGEAYAVLSDPAKRDQYDRFGHKPPPGGFEWGGGFPDFFELFNMAFGGGWGGGRAARQETGADLRADVTLTLEEVLTGVEREVPVSRLTTCEACEGSGAAPGTDRVTCPTCGGAGRVRDVRSGFGVQFATVRTCPHCGGTGTYVAEPCSHCQGRGRRRRTRKVTVKVPPGVETGQRIRVTGEGDAGPWGAPSGDLYVFLEVAAHDVFRRDGNSVICEVQLSFAQAALGTVVEVPTLDGPAEIGVPAGTQTGEVFTLRGHGLPELHRGRRGDQYVRVRVLTPHRLNKKQRELLTKFAEQCGETVRPYEGGFFDKVKRAIREERSRQA